MSDRKLKYEVADNCGYTVVRDIMKFELCLSKREISHAKAFDDGYSDYAAQNVYLNDNDSFIEHIKGKCRYIATIKHGSKYYAIREFFEDGIVYVNDSPDMTYPVKLTFKADDHEQNALMVSKSTFVMQYLKKVFEHGQLRFNNLDSKNIIFDILSI